MSSRADSDVNCTITFRTKSAQQHFIIRFEELKLGCDDHLKMFDGDLDYGQPSIKDFSCRDNLASVPILKTTGTYLTIRFSTGSKTKSDDGFRLVVTAVFDINKMECPHDYTVCHNFLCISRSLICDDVNHCLDNSDEIDCSSRGGLGSSSSSGAGLLATSATGGSYLLPASGDTSLSYAFVLLIVLGVISICVTICVSALCCRRESHYAQFQHHLQRAIGVPMQTSSSLMFTNHPQQYHYFQPANLSPFITPQHQHQLQQQLQQQQHHQHQLAAAGATLPRGYSTLPLNLAAARQQATLQQQPILAKPMANEEFLMMAGLGGPSSNQTPIRNNAVLNLAGAPAQQTMQTNLYLPTSQSILASTAIANNGASQLRFPPPHQARLER